MNMLNKIKTIRCNNNLVYVVLKQDMEIQQFYEVFYISKNRQKLFNINADAILYANKTYTITTRRKNEHIQTSPHDIEIVYEDDICLIVNKPTNLLIHDDGASPDTLCSRVNFYTLCNNYKFFAYPIHRIDKETSGLVFFVKHPFFHSFFDHQIQEHIIKKQYLGVVQGTFPYRHKHIEKPISRDRHDAKKMIISNKGKAAITDVYKVTTKDHYSLLSIGIKTGRKHQIRTHLKYIGYPIVNDPLYGHILDNRKLLLESYAIDFYHPLENRFIHIQAPIDPRFKPFSHIDLTSTIKMPLHKTHQK